MNAKILLSLLTFFYYSKCMEHSRPTELESDVAPFIKSLKIDKHIPTTEWEYLLQHSISENLNRMLYAISEIENNKKKQFNRQQLNEIYQVIGQLIKNSYSQKAINTALYNACSYCNVEKVKILVIAGAQANEQKSNPLSSLNHTALIETLLDCELNGRNERDATEIARFFIKETDVDINAQTFGHYDNALSLAARWGWKEIVKMLLDKDIDLSNKERNLDIMYWTIKFHQTEIIQMLIEGGLNCDWQMAFERAEKFNYSDIKELIAQKLNKINL